MSTLKKTLDSSSEIKVKDLNLRGKSSRSVRGGGTASVDVTVPKTTPSGPVPIPYPTTTTPDSGSGKVCRP